VWLTAGNQCGATAVETFNALGTGLTTRFPERILGAEGLSEADVRLANARSRESGEASQLAYGFANDTVAVGVVVQLSVTPSVPYPYGGGSVATALWRLGQSSYDQRKAECSGTGDRRMDIVVRYMTRTALQADMDRAIAEDASAQQAIADKL